MQVSHSRVECFEGCPFKYRLRYIEHLETIKADNPDNALFLGTALHTGLEKNVEAAIHEYFMQFPVITDAHVNEAIKLEQMIPKAAAMIPKGFNEVEISDDDFKGFIDLLAPVTSDTRLGGEYQELPGVYDIYDFKYSNNVSHYKESVQIHLYKYFYEKLNPGKKIRKLIYLCVPKVNSKQKKDESLQDFRNRIQEECRNTEPKLVEVEYDQGKVLDWLFQVKHMTEATDFPQNQSWLCRYCEYNDYCQKGWNFMILPKNERRNIEQVQKKVIWLYGSPFSGKTTFANKFPDPLMLNTDGNIKFVDAPFIPIKDQVEVVRRMTKRTKGWEVFKDVISELEKKDNTFKTIVVDLLEDTYEQCRLYMYEQMGITHESDDSFRAWDKVRTEFLSTLKRLMGLDYENIILISHEDTTKDITKKGGDKVTAIKPNLQEKTANKVAGMVDIVARVVADGEIRTLSFKTNEVIFGGGRLLTKTDEIPLDYDAFLDVYAEANEAAAQSMHQTTSKAPARSRSTKKAEVAEVDKGTGAIVGEEVMNPPVEDAVPDKPLDAEEALAKETAQAEAEDAEMKAAQESVEPNTGEVIGQEEPAKPRTRTRKRRTE